jgi:hypothetical protein
VARATPALTPSRTSSLTIVIINNRVSLALVFKVWGVIVGFLFRQKFAINASGCTVQVPIDSTRYAWSRVVVAKGIQTGKLLTIPRSFAPILNMNPGGSSDHLIVQNNPSAGGSFAQQGTIDWGNLAQATATASVEVLSRFSGAGVDPYTIIVGQTISSQFRLSRLGLHRLQSALENLPVISGIGDAIWFGFGIKHVVRSLAQTTEGQVCIMLCASLAEVHSTGLSARILSAMVDIASRPGSKAFTPSLAQWHSLINTCSGVLAPTSFGVVAEHIMGLAGDTFVARGGQGCRTAGDPKDIARVLAALARLSTDSALSIKISGGTKCGWIAAVAHWFFELDVEIRSSNGTILYPSARKGKEPQLLVIFEPKDPESIQVVGKSYIIKDLTHGLMYKDGLETSRVTGRVRWETALYQTFGNSAQRLLNQTSVFARSIGSAARIFQAISLAEGEGNFTMTQLEDWCSWSDDGYGRGYVTAAMVQLPELAPLRDKIETALESSYTDALGEYQICKAKLTTLCNCEICGTTYDSRNVAADSLRPFCLALLSEVVIRLLWQLSTFAFDENLFLTRAGLEEFYHEHKTVFKHCKYPQHGQNSDSGSLLQDLDYVFCLPRAVTLFTGRTYGRSSRLAESKACPAIVSGGLCFYLPALEKLSDRPEVFARINIVPGRIQAESGRSFDILEDASVVSRIPVLTYEAENPSRVDGIPTSAGACSPAFDIKLVVEETVNSLTVFHHIAIGDRFCAFGPLLLTRLLIKATGVVGCPRRGCSELASPYPPIATVSGEGLLCARDMERAGHGLVIRQVDHNPTARCIAIFLDKSRTSSPGNRDHEGRVEIEDDPQEYEYDVNDVTSDLSITTILQVDECQSVQ